MDIQTLFNLNGRVALVTGGSRGIGKMIVEGYLKAGAARVYISARKVDQIEETVAEFGNQVIGLPCDLSTVDGCLSLAAQIAEREEKVDILVNNAGAAWGYAIQNNGAATTEDTSIWQLVLQDLNVQFPIRTAALDDIDGLEANVVDDMLMEFSQAEALSMIQNNDQGSTSLPYGGSNGLRGLDQYAGANSTYTGGTCTTAAFGSSGTGSSSGLHSLATYDQLTTNANTVGANNISYVDVINTVYSLPQQYWTPDTKFMISPILLNAIRALRDSQGAPIFNRNEGLSVDGIVGTMLGFDVVVNKYCDTPSQTTVASAGTTSLYPMYFGDFTRGHTIIDRLNMIMRRYDQTQPGFITFFGEKRLATSVRDPNALIRYRSTGTAA